jgi:AcrR family transcriptional regulator
MGPEGGQRRDAVANHQAVIDAAVEVLRENPGAGMQEIADHSGLGRTTVYRHFHTREALVQALIRQGIATSGERLEGMLREEPDLETGLREVGELYAELGLRYGFQFLRRPEVRAMLDRVSHDPDAPLARYLAATRGRGESRTDIPIAWLLSQFTALAIALANDGDTGRLDPDRAGALLGDTFFSMAVSR